MAVDRVDLLSTMRMQFQTGIDEDGNPKHRTKSISNVKSDADDQDIFDVGLVLSELQENTLVGLQRIDTAGLEDAG